MITPNHVARQGWLMVCFAELRLDGQLEPVAGASPILLGTAIHRSRQSRSNRKQSAASLEPALSPLGYPRVDVDPYHPAADGLEVPGGDAGTAADVGHVGPGTGGDDTVHHGLGIAGPGPVETFGVRVERLRYLSVLMRLGFGKTSPYRGRAPRDACSQPTRISAAA